MRQRNKRLAVVMVAACLFGAMTAQGKEWKAVKIATEGSYEPWNLTLPGGKLGGFEPELMEVLCQRMALKCDIQVQSWDGMIAALNAGKFDVLMDAIVITDERRQVMAFSQPYARTPASFVAAKADLLPGTPGSAGALTLDNDPAKIKPAIEGLRKALDGQTIGIASGTVYTPFIDEYFKDVATVREYSTSADAILDLTAGRLDAVFDDVTFLNATLEKPDNKGLAYTGPEIAGPIWGEGEALGFRKADTDLKARFDEELKKAIADGTVKRLSEKWFKVDLTP